MKDDALTTEITEVCKREPLGKGGFPNLLLIHLLSADPFGVTTVGPLFALMMLYSVSLPNLLPAGQATHAKERGGVTASILQQQVKCANP